MKKSIEILRYLALILILIFAIRTHNQAQENKQRADELMIICQDKNIDYHYDIALIKK